MASPNWDKLYTFMKYGSGNPSAENKAQFDKGYADGHFQDDTGWIEKLKFQYENGTAEERKAIQEVMDKKDQEGWNGGVGDAFGISAIRGIANRVDDRDIAAQAKDKKDEADALTKKQNEDTQRSSLTDRISQYVKGLQGDVSPDDPVMKGLTAAGVDAGQKAYGMSGSGFGGGYEGRLSAAAAQRAALPYLQQRQQLAAQGMGLLNQRDIGLGQLSQGANQLQMQREQMQHQQSMENFAARQQEQMAPWSAIGGILGLGGGIASGFIPGVGASGAMKALPGLMSGGSNLLGGLGASGAQWRGGRGYGGGGGGTY